MNIGVLGGTFDPVHLGHLAIAEEARRHLKMAKILFVPAGHPYFKSASSISLSKHRVNMINLAFADKPYFEISLSEIKRRGPSYAVDTLSQIKRHLATGDEVFFILGWDSLVTLHLWRAPERLISLCRLVGAPRPGYPRPDISLLEKDLPGISQRTVMMDKPVMDISSTLIRQRVRQGLPIDHLVPADVARYIKEHKLYTGGQ